MAKKPSTRKGELGLILERLAALEERIARLEGQNDAAVALATDFNVATPPSGPAEGSEHAPLPPSAAVVGRAPGAAAPSPASELPEEILLVLSAAVAAFLGERAHIRQARLVHTDAWAQQGRVSVMASHRWAVHR